MRLLKGLCQRSPDGARRRFTALCVVLPVLHAYFWWAFGAVFWVDAFNYMELGDAMTSSSALRAFVDRYGPWLFPSYIGAGIPLISVWVRTLPVVLQWPALAAGQHLLAAVAVLYAVRTLDRLWPSPWHAVAALTLTLIPFYQSFHNSLMSESIAGSMMILSCALALRLIIPRTLSIPHFAALMAVLLVQSQIRLNMIPGLALVVCLVLVRHRAFFSLKSVAFAATLVSAVFVPAMLRYAATGMWMFPLPDFGHLRMSIESNPNPSEGLVREFSDAFPGLDEATCRQMVTEGLWGREAILTEWWRRSGLSSTEVSMKVVRLCSQIDRDSPERRLNSLRYGLNSCGACFAWRTGDLSTTVWRGHTMKGMLYKQLGHYRWLSWTYHDSYAEDFRFLIEREQNRAPVPAQFIAMCKPYLSKGRTAWRDPFRLGRVYPDLLFLAGLVSAAILCVVRPWVGGVFLAVIGCHFMVHAGSAHGNIRYFYPLMTVCFVAAGVAGALIGQLVCRRNTEVES